MDDQPDRVSLRRRVRLFSWFLLAMSVFAARIDGTDLMAEFFRNSVSTSLWGLGIVLQVFAFWSWLKDPVVEWAI